MKIFSKKQSKTAQISPTCAVTEYPMAGESEINIAIVSLSGRYPESGCVVNDISKELAYVTKGEGKLILNGDIVHLKSGDVVLIEPGEKYFWEGHMTLLLSCTPAWHPEQHRWVEEEFLVMQL